MNRRKLFSILIALSLILITIPITIEAALDEWAISYVDEDVFWATYRFDDNDMMYLQGDDIRIIGWYLFEGPDVLKAGYPISEAYLSVMTTGTEIVDPDASMTLYGVPTKKGGALSIYGEDDEINIEQVNGPYTTNYVNVNLSSFVGNGVWHNITVTNIVREINQAWYFYNGHNIAFVTLSPDNHDAERYVASEESGHAAKLYVHYKTPDPEDPEYDPDLPEEAEWVEDYRNHTIWVFGFTGIEYLFTSGTSSPYDIIFDYIGNGKNVSISQTETDYATAFGGYKKIVKTSNGILYAVFSKEIAGKHQIHVKKSEDKGETWIDETLISTYDGMGSYDQLRTVIAVDSDDGLHVFWDGKATGFTAGEQIWYRNYTTSWGAISRIYVDRVEYEMHLHMQNGPSVALNSIDDVQVVWYGKKTGDTEPQIYSVKFNSTHYIAGYRVSIYDGMDTRDQRGAIITFDKDDYVHIVWRGRATGYPVTQIWYITNQGGWSTERISTDTDMEDYDQNVPDITVDSDDYIHVVWFGKVSGYPNQYQIWYAKNTTSWSAPLRISTYSGMNTNNQSAPSIAVDSDDILHVLFHGKATGFLDYNKIWYTLYNTSWTTPGVLHPTGQNTYPTIRWSKYPILNYTNIQDYFVTDPNGTIVWTGNGDLNVTDVEDIIDDDIIGYPDPEDPDPSGWEDPVYWSIHRFKLLLFLIGMILLIGSPVYGFAERPEAATWIMLMMNMLIGVALLWSLQTM